MLMVYLYTVLNKLYIYIVIVNICENKCKLGFFWTEFWSWGYLVGMFFFFILCMSYASLVPNLNLLTASGLLESA